MLSYNINDKEIVFQIYEFLRNQEMPVWINRSENVTADSLHDSLANGVENAAAVFCFLTPDYERSPVCKLELQYAHKRSKLIIPCLFDDKKFWNDSSWLTTVVGSLHCYNIKEIQNKDKMHLQELINSLYKRHSSSKHVLTESLGPPNYLFELIKYKYLCDNKIERFMDPSKTFPIEQSYINLAIVETKETQEKEKKLDNTQSIDAVMGVFEKIYGSKSPIDVKDIFTKCKDQNRNILVFGRAGIGKSTFCRYAAYQWATGAIWPEYELVVLVPLRSLTGPKYPKGKDYSLIDILINHYFSHPFWSDEQKNKLAEQIRRSKILWLLDGYDEIAQDQPRHLQILLEQLLKTPHHIITSRPYMNTLPYSVKMEITGFTDENIPNYIKLFFNQLGNPSREDENLLNFLQSNPKIWGIAHIPINLELICSVWIKSDWAKTKVATMTGLYNGLTESICRRYLAKQKNILSTDLIFMVKKDVYEKCKMELAFLERLAFLGMENNLILLSPTLVRNAEKNIITEPSDRKNLFNFGILKSYDSNIGRIRTHNEVEKDYYFVHLSFQEYFAARYLAKALSGTARNKAIEFIQQHKYNQRYQLLFAFLAGLLSETCDSRLNIKFWNTIFNEPLDITRMQHMALVIRCVDEINSNQTFIEAQQLFQLTARWVETAITHKSRYLHPFVTNILRACNTICNATHIQQALVRLLHHNQTTIVCRTLAFISSIPLNNPTNSLKRTVLQKIQHKDSDVKQEAFEALTSMYQNAATKELIEALLKALSDTDHLVRRSASEAFRRINVQAATPEMIDLLLKALSDDDPDIRWNACYAIGRIGEKAVTKEVIDALHNALLHDYSAIIWPTYSAFNRMAPQAATKEVINALVKALSDDDSHIRWNACYAIGRIGEKAATKEVIDALLKTLWDDDSHIRNYAGEAFDRMAKNAATKEVIDALLKALSDSDLRVRRSASQAIGRLGQKAATKEVIDALVKALSDDDSDITWRACYAIGRIGEKAATKEAIGALLKALSHIDHRVRRSACYAIGRMGEKAAEKELINALVKVLLHDDSDTKWRACEAIGRIGEKAATKEVIDALLNALSDHEFNIRRYACEGIGRMSKKAATKEVIDALVKALSDGASDIRWRACYAIGRIGEKAATKEVIGALLKTLWDHDFNTRKCAGEAFDRMAKNAATKEVIDALVKALSDDDSAIRWSACYAIGRIGEKAATKEAINALLRALSDSDLRVRGGACEAFGRIGENAATKEVMDALLKALFHSDHRIRRSACYTIGRMSEKAATKEVIGALLRALSDSDLRVRGGACYTIGRINERAATKEMIDALLKALSDHDFNIRRCACEGIGRMSKKAATKEVIDALVKALSDGASEIRWRACYAIGRIGEKAATKEVIGALLKALSHSGHRVRRSACYAIGRMGEKAARKELINALVRALSDSDHLVSSSACMALNRVVEKVTTTEIMGVAAGFARAWNERKNLYKYEMRRWLCAICALDVFGDNDIGTTEERIVSKSCIDSELILPGKLIKILIQTGDRVFLGPAVHGCIIGGAAVSVVENSLWIHERGRVTRVMIPKCKMHLAVELRQLFSEEVDHVYAKLAVASK
ncbi:unnamed protein product [Adineta ricciae]|uniref:NACHT domain-containing protein n=2 Tax=Adineta ricciae TaxID=249248 RepID=A0A816AZ19_ADIRI|nr:unnamed protein product [Adineta ricciae]